MPGHAPGFYFCPAAIQPHTSVYSVFCAIHTSYTANATKQRARLYRSVSGYLQHFTAVYARQTHADIIPPVPRWSAHTRPDALPRYQIPAPRRTLYRSAQPPYYNKVYKGAGVRPCYGSMPDGAADRTPCQPGGVSIPPTPGGLQSGTLHPAGKSSGRGTAGGAEPLTATAVALFGFSPDS